MPREKRPQRPETQEDRRRDRYDRPPTGLDLVEALEAGRLPLYGTGE